MLQNGLPGESESKAEAAALAGRYEWLEEFGTNFRGDSRARIVYMRHREAHVELGPDAYFSTLGHGLDGIADQVHKGALYAAAYQRHFDFRRD